MLMHGKKKVDTIFVHQTTTRPDWMANSNIVEKVAEIDKWHRDRGWRMIGYHYVIDRNGEVMKGRNEDEVGAHVAGHNTGSIGITLVGGHGASMNDPFDKNFTPQQDGALRELIEDIKTRADIKHVRGHCEVANKVCPGFSVKKFMRDGVEKAPRETVAASTTVQASGTQMLAGAATIATATGSLQGNAQLIVVVAGVIMVLTAAWIMRERIKYWVEGVR